MSLFEELRRRNVIRVGIAYAVTAWLLLQVADVVLNNIAAPGWVFQVIMLLLALGFPLVMIFSWAFEITPEGIKREVDVPKDQSIVTQTARKLDRTIMIVLVLAVGYFIWESRFADRPAPEQNEPTAAQTTGTVEADLGGPAEPSIAVLPFADMSPNKDQEFFSDGIAEELLNLLVRVDGIKVASRTSAFSYKNSTLNLAQIAEELQVDHVLEGSIRKADNRVRVTAQLIDAATDRHLWSDTYDRELSDIFGIQDEIANSIVHALRAELGIDSMDMIVAVETVTENLDAYELYLKARALFLARSDLEEAIDLFEQSVNLDPKFARAWAGLSANYTVMNSWGHFDRDYPALAAKAAQAALDIDPALSTPWAVRALLKRNEADFITSARYMEKAIELDPKDATHYLWRGIHSSALGFQEQALEDFQRCLALDPLYENCRRHVAAIHFFLGQDEEGMRYLLEGIERGYTGMEWAMTQRMATLGHDLLLAYMTWAHQDRDSAFPGKDLIEAMRHPEQDHSLAVRKLLAFREATGTPASSFTHPLAVLRAWDRLPPSSENIEWIWLDENREFLRSEYFKPWAEESGLAAYWSAVGFPPRCKPVGTDDYECE